MMEIAMTNTPLPCPLCERALELMVGRIDSMPVWWRHTNAPDCPIEGTMLTTEVALAAWNRRVPPPGQAALVEALRGDLDRHPFIEPVVRLLREADNRLAREKTSGDLLRIQHAEGWVDALGHAVGMLKLAALSAVADGADAAGVGS